ncbi:MULTISPECIES: hypothetical protein [unclassified Micromonospora]|uniref:hypothetical protein n=1 Tax=unclassified Micromonospora TaxID=2617518 RepID=UPI0022BAB8CC|nr:hypothetical protein [Micromonospora sp. AKA38]GHJ15946.1 hypothetical protein TPA0908_39410 [Micromonospora sp. AKA38]
MQTHESPTVRLNWITEQRCSPVGPPRESRIGSWYPLASTSGSMHEGLLVSGVPPAGPTFALRVPGLVKVVDCLYDEQQMWLVTDTPPHPTLARVATAAGGTPGPAAIAVAAASGEVMLLEVGLARAFAGTGVVTAILIILGLLHGIRAGGQRPRSCLRDGT